MQGLTADLLSQACRTFLVQAYAGGAVPAAKRFFLECAPPPPLSQLLAPPMCQQLAGPDGGFRGYALRLGCGWFPHVKLQIITCAADAWVFSVDTHDAMELAPDHPDLAGLAVLQAANRRLKEQIERAWEAEGIKTFHSLLRQGITKEEGREEERHEQAHASEAALER